MTNNKNLGKQMMSQSKFYMGYSRWVEDKGRYETWEEAVERVMNMHYQKYQDKLSDELMELMNFAETAYKNKLILGAQRALQFGGEQLFHHETRLYNCFSGDTRIITAGGVSSFEELGEGAKVVVPTHTGAYQNAVVKTYGKQSLNKVTFSKGDLKKEVLVTGNHRWILHDGSETTSLKVGDRILKPVDTFSEFDYDTAEPFEKLMWCYGLVFGDGTRVYYKGTHNYSMIRLCGYDKRFASRFEEMGFKTSTNEDLDGDFMAYTGRYLKTVPSEDVDLKYVKAFVAGYLQADGEKNRNKSGKQYRSIQSSEKDHQEFIEKMFEVVGVYINSVKDLTGQPTNYTTQDGRKETKKYSLCDSFGSKYQSGWKVESIEESVKEDVVWCLEVEEDHSFILSGGLVTGNCATSYCDRVSFFQEAMYMLLCGCGVGFSVQHKHIDKLPKIQRRNSQFTTTFTIPDSIEGWADAFGVLLSSYCVDGGTFPEVCGHVVHFDFNEIRPKGAYISGGFKAPGADGLRIALQKCEALLENLVKVSDEPVKINSITAYDFVMHMSDAVLSGGVRRSATICLFSPDDEDMLTAKTGDWYISNPQRGRSNNSVLIMRDSISREDWHNFFDSVKQYGEPGFIFSDDEDFLYNPCVEVGMKPQHWQTGESGWQVCNLCEINGGACDTPEKFYDACKAAAILGTIQAGYTNFNYLSKVSKEIVDHEALIGVSVTGWMNNPDVLFNENVMKEGARIVKAFNADVADLIGINHAARCTVVKPSGNASVILGTASGIHGEHAPLYFRNVQMNDQDEVLHLIQETNPQMVEDSVWSNTGTDKVVYFPIVTKDGSIYKKDLLGVKQLEFVKKAQQVWIEEGTNIDLCVDKRLRHNVSNTITVDDWDEVEEYIYNNRYHFAGISLLSAQGDKAYPQAPFTEVFTGEQILERYGNASLFASGLIVDGLAAFDNHLWRACDTVNGCGLKLDPENSKDLLKRDWVRRAVKFANNYFNGDLLEMTNCLKDCYNWHKWCTIERTMKEVDFSKELSKATFTDVDTLGAQGCSGGACEIAF